MDAFWIQHRRSEEQFQLKHHFEHRYQVVFIQQGKVRYQVGDKEYLLTRGGMIVLNTLESHTLEVLEYPYERYIFQIDPYFFQQELRYPEIISIFIRRPPEFSHLIRLPEEVWDYAHSCIIEMECEYKEKSDYWKMIVGAGLRRLMITVFRACREEICIGKVDAGASLAFEIQNYLDQNYLKDLSIDEIAEQFFLNKHYIAHLFKDVTGYSIMKYVITLRMNKARVLLVESDETISSIASRCGYTDFTHFTKQFRKYENCTPRQYRKLKQESQL